MYTRTRIPKHTNCVRFYGSQSSEAYKMISLFLHGKGRIANAIDVVNARVSHGFASSFWQCYITTTSTEWFGLNAKGKPVIIILHDKPPFLNDEGLKMVTPSEKFSVISREIFLMVCAGTYGPVIEIPFSRAIEEENKNNSRYGRMTRALCDRNELLIARLGGKESAKAYLDAHEAGSRKESGEHNWNYNEESKEIIKCDLDEYSTFTKLIEVAGYPRKVALRRSSIKLQSEAAVSFIGLGCKFNGKETDVNLYSVHDSCAFLAITSDTDPIHTVRGLSMYSKDDYTKYLSDLFITFSGEREDYYELAVIKKWYFTHRFREKIPIGDEQVEWFVTSDPTFSIKGEPKYLVKNLKPLGRRTFKVPVKQGYYTHDMVRALFESNDANAFEILSGFKEVDDFYIAVVAYYKAEVYTDRIIPIENEILSDRKLFSRII